MKTIRDAALFVAGKWPDLHPTAFVEQVRSQFYPRPDDNAVCGEMWAMFSDGTLQLTSERTVRLP